MNAQSKIAANGTATIHAADLVKALRFATAVIQKRNTIPILSTALLDFDADSLTVTGTDLDIQCRMTVEAECDTPFKLCVGPRAMEAFARMDLSDRIKISLADETMQIEAGGVTAKFRQLFPCEDFPAFTDKAFLAPKGTASVPEAVMARILADVAPFISPEETRYCLNGIYLHAKEAGTLIGVATDGRRLAMRRTDVPWAGLDGICPTKVVKLLRGLISEKGNRELLVCGDDRFRRIAPATGEWDIKHKLIDGTYPDYTRVIPKPSEAIRVPLSWGQIRRAMVVANPSSSTAVAFRPGAGVMTAANIDDEIEVSMPMPGAVGEDFGLNVRYVATILRRHGTAVVKSSGKSDPMTFETEDPNLTIVVMPMRI